MAGNQELIDSIVDPIAVKQVDDLKKHVDDLEASFVVLAKSALAANNATGSSTTGGGFTKAVNESNKATKTLVENVEKTRLAEIRLQQAREKSIDQYNKQNSSYAKLTKAYNDATIAARNAGAEFGVNSRQFETAKGSVTLLRKELDNIDQPLGNFQRNVGNYASSIGGLFTKVYGYIRTAANILPGVGISGVFLLGFEGISFVIDKLGLLSTKTSDVAVNLKNFNDVMNDASKEYGEQSTKLDILYKAATDVNNSMKNRVDAAKALKKEFPETFANLKNETILNGQAATAYDKTTDAIIANAKARAASAKIAELAGKLFEADILNQKIEIANNNQRVKLEQEAYDRTVDAFKFEQKRRGLSTTLTQEQLTNLKKVSDASVVYGKYEVDVETQKAKDKNEILKKSLQDQIDLIKKVGGGNNVIADAIDGSDKEKPKKAPDTRKKELDEQLKAVKLAEETILQNTESALDDRLLAIDSYYSKSKAIIDKGEKDKVVTSLEGSNLIVEIENTASKQRLDINKKATDDLIKAFKDGIEADKKRLKDEEDNLSDSNNKRLLLNDQYADEAYNLLASRYKQGLITAKEFEDGRAIIEQEANLQSIDSAIQLSEDLIAINKKAGENTQAEEDKLAKLKLQRSKLVRDGVISDLKTEAEARKKVADLTKQVADEAAQFVITLVDAGFENRKNKIQEQINLVDDQSKAEIDAVNRSLATNTDKAAKVQLIEAQAAAQKTQLQREQKRTDIEKAKFDKAVSLARIVEATAVAEIEALTYLSNPLTAPFYPSIAALIGALGAIQLATVLAQPIPQYAKGTKNAKGGMSLVGEKGTEYVMTPQGATFLTPGKPTLMDIPKGSTVVPHLETVRMMDVKKFTGGVQTDMSEVVQAINRKQFKTGKTVIGGWRNEHRASAQWETRKNQYFN
jgi:hypothetical protein